MAGGQPSRAAAAISFIRGTLVTEGIVSNDAVYYGVAPQTVAYPYSVISIISSIPTPTQPSGSAVETFRLQIDFWAKADSTHSGFYNVELMAHNARLSISRIADPSSYDPFIIDSVQEAGGFSDYIPEIDVYRCTQDYMVRVK